MHHAIPRVIPEFLREAPLSKQAAYWADPVGALRGLVKGEVKPGEWKAKLQVAPIPLMAGYLATTQAQGQWRGAADVGQRGH
jgi:hypothetical protein